MESVPDPFPVKQASEFRLPWQRTWADNPTDFDAHDPESPGGYCRIYKAHVATDRGSWFWTAATAKASLGTGYERTARLAAEAAERAYFATQNEEPAP